MSLRARERAGSMGCVSRSSKNLHLLRSEIGWLWLRNRRPVDLPRRLSRRYFQFVRRKATRQDLDELRVKVPGFATKETVLAAHTRRKRAETSHYCLHSSLHWVLLHASLAGPAHHPG
jgi:hypothetical protein